MVDMARPNQGGRRWAVGLGAVMLPVRQWYEYGFVSCLVLFVVLLPGVIVVFRHREKVHDFNSFEVCALLGVGLGLLGLASWPFAETAPNMRGGGTASQNLAVAIVGFAVSPFLFLIGRWLRHRNGSTFKGSDE
jgi:hypothetical protein